MYCDCMVSYTAPCVSSLNKIQQKRLQTLLIFVLYYVEERQTFRDFNLGLTIYTIHYELVYYFTVANLA